MSRAVLTYSCYFTDLALNEVRRYHPHVSVSHPLFPGYSLLDAPCSFDKLTAPWRHRLPIYLHHCFPVHKVISLHSTQQDVMLLERAVKQLGLSDATVQLRAATESVLPYSLEELEEAIYGKRRRASLRPPTGRILSVLIAEEAAGLAAYLGVSWATQNLSPWAGGQIPITEPVSNRAGYKLLEALDTFGIEVRRGSRILDLGAAPGAWTTLLRNRGANVTAVAPTSMYPWLAFDASVKHEPMLAEDYLQRCDVTFDLIVNDMKLDGQDSARLMVSYAPHLRPTGVAIMTLKLRAQNVERVMDHSFRILRKAYTIVRVRQLVSNKREVTLFLRRRSL